MIKFTRLITPHFYSPVGTTVTYSAQTNVTLSPGDLSHLRSVQGVSGDHTLCCPVGASSGTPPERNQQRIKFDVDVHKVPVIVKWFIPCNTMV
jgi:hypothetical protein